MAASRGPELIKTGKLTASDIVTHRVKLSDTPRMYQTFNDKKENILKIVMTP